MALGPKDVSFIDVALLESLESKIDEALSNTHLFYLEWGGGTRNHGAWVVLPCKRNLTTDEKEELKNRYEKAGWKEVIVRNSTDNGEKAGLVTLIIPSEYNDLPFPKKYRPDFSDRQPA